MKPSVCKIYVQFHPVLIDISTHDRSFTYSRGISTVHAIFITFMSVYLVFFSDLFSDKLDGPVTFRSSNLSNITLAVKYYFVPIQEMPMLACIFYLPHIGLISFVQVSVGYFITDIAMIFWVYPSLGGMEYVSALM